MLQWIHSKASYLNEYNEKWKETIEADKYQKEELEGHLKKLQSPFGFLDALRSLKEEEDDEYPEGEAPDPKTLAGLGAVLYG